MKANIDPFRKILAHRLAEAQLALMLLTRLPAGQLRHVPPMGAAFWAYPLAGVLVGALSGGAGALAMLCGLPEQAAALIALGTGVLATGALHEDGLADSADACGGRDPAQRLAIMKDSRIGSFGVVALIIVMGLRGVLIAQIATAGPMILIASLAAIGAASRAGLPLMLATQPAARPDGLGLAAAQGGTRQGAAIATLVGAATLTVAPGGLAAAVCGALVLAVLAACARSARKHLGGITGDVLGTAQMLTETALLAAFVAIPLSH